MKLSKEIITLDQLVTNYDLYLIRSYINKKSDILDVNIYISYEPQCYHVLHHNIYDNDRYQQALIKRLDNFMSTMHYEFLKNRILDGTL